jgi:hypothetical protein
MESCIFWKQRDHYVVFAQCDLAFSTAALDGGEALWYLAVLSWFGLLLLEQFEHRSGIEYSCIDPFFVLIEPDDERASACHWVLNFQSHFVDVRAVMRLARVEDVLDGDACQSLPACTSVEVRSLLDHVLHGLMFVWFDISPQILSSTIINA